MGDHRLMGFDLTDVTRVEVIDKDGRSYSRGRQTRVSVQLQDGGRTLKIFTEDA